MTATELHHLHEQLAWVRLLAGLATNCERMLAECQQLEGERLKLAVRNSELHDALKSLGQMTETPPKLKLVEPDLGGEA